MVSANKSFSLLLICILAVSMLIMVKPAYSQSIPTPSVPQFTMQLVGPSYTVPTTYSLDPNTGKIVAKIGYTNPYSNLEIDVKNQPFDSTYDNPYFNVRVKLYNSTGNWVEVYESPYGFPQQSNGSEYTDVGFPIEGATFVGTIAGSQIDIQVEAMYGYWGRTSTALGGQGFIAVATSAWSNTQTISIPANTPLSPTATSLSPTSTPTVTPVNSAPSSSTLWLIITIDFVVIAFLLAVIIALILLVRKRKTVN